MDGWDITICIVTFRPDIAEVHATCTALVSALSAIPHLTAKLFIIDNSPPDALAKGLPAALSGCEVEIIAGHGNIGFGAANNQVLGRTGTYHLVLNPDVEMDKSALAEAMAYMSATPDCGLISPQATWPDGRRQYLAKRFPEPFDLLIRGFAPLWLRKLFEARLSRYEMRRETDAEKPFAAPIVSGCFMFFRGNLFEKLRGFDPRYFLYFEDFDLSLRASECTKVIHLPAVKIVHGGGNAASKGFWHIRQFLRSSWVFYSSHGLRES
ncbi:glycosyltransferase [Mesorhizobium sp. NBSH29]|nr:glycosyltransferase [Mesorhizobium sp. NBSH29]